MPERIQRKRTKGWRMPENTVYVGRPSDWGNEYGSVLEFTMMAKYLRQIAPDSFESWISPLRGKNLACWCKLSDPCHADVLLELANEGAK